MFSTSYSLAFGGHWGTQFSPEGWAIAAIAVFALSMLISVAAKKSK